VLLTALHRQESGELFCLGGKPRQSAEYDHPWLVRVVEAPEGQSVCEQTEQTMKLPNTAIEELKQALDFHYPYHAATAAPSKQTATQRKGRIKDQEAAENAQEPKPWQRSWRKPSFIQSPVSGTMRGNATHQLLQYIRFENCVDKTAVEKELERLISEGFLTPEQAALVDCGQLARFFASPMGIRLRGSEQILREFKFSILDDGCAFDTALEGEKILLQGVVDCALVEPDGITVLDFKTDRVSEETLPTSVERYRPQVEAYADALCRIFEKEVKEKYLYFFHLDRLVKV
jgi:ATP-dependent helicase/nuclease subunit A